jgi:hypothetical protein
VREVVHTTCTWEITRLGSAVHVDFIPLHLFGTMLVWNERETVHLVLALLLVRASARDFNFQWVTGLHSVK